MESYLPELHKELLDITGYFKKVCQENDIPFYLAFGSCLGAVRHKNIIPWDDDVDLYVPCAAYPKMKETFLRLNDPIYFYQDADTDTNHFLPFAKIRKNHTTSMPRAERALDMNWGICIDMFPLFSYDRPDPSFGIKLKAKLLRVLASMPYGKVLRQNTKQKVAGVFYSMIGVTRRKKWINKLFYSIERPGDYYYDPESGKVFKKELMGTPVYQQFGEKMYPIPEQYDNYLTLIYGGDYMKVPKEGSADYYTHGDIIVDCHEGFEVYR